MKKKVLLYAGLILTMAALAGCGKKKDKEAAPEDEVVTEEAGEVKEEAPAEAPAEEPEEVNLTVENDLFSITMPEDTAGKFEAEVSENSISIYDKEAKEADFGGFAFSVAAYREPSEYFGGMETKAGELTDADGNLYDITIHYPSEFQYDYVKYGEKMPESYEKLYKGAEEIVKTLQAKDGGSFVFGAGTKGEDLYPEILKKHITAIEQGWDANRLEEEGMSSMYYSIAAGGENALERIGYAYADANYDGIDELFIGEIAEGDWKGVVYDIYTMADRAPVHVVSGWGRSRYYMLDGGMIVNEYSSGANESGWDIYDIEPNTGVLLPQVRMKYDGYENSEQPWFIAYGQDEEWENVTEEEFEQRRENFKEYTRFDYTPLAEAAAEMAAKTESEADYLGIVEDHKQQTVSKGYATFTEMVDKSLQDGQGYTNEDLGEEGVLLVSSSTFSGYGNDAAAEAEIFGYKDGAPVYLGFVQSGGSGTPLAVSDGKLMAAGHHYVGKYAVEDGKLVTAEEAWEVTDAEGVSTYHYNSNSGDYSNMSSNAAKAVYDALYQEYLDAKILAFDTIRTGEAAEEEVTEEAAEAEAAEAAEGEAETEEAAEAAEAETAETADAVAEAPEAAAEAEAEDAAAEDAAAAETAAK